MSDQPKKGSKRRRERDSGVGDSPEQEARPQPPPPARLPTVPEEAGHRDPPRDQSDTSDSEDDQVGLLQPPRVQVRPQGPLADPDSELAGNLAALEVLPDPEVVIHPQPIEIDIDPVAVMDAAQFNTFMDRFGERMNDVVGAIPAGGGGGGAGGAAAHGAQGGQIQSVIPFSGEDTKDPKIWLNSIEMLATAYHWNDATIAEVAKSRCTDTANKWVTSQKILGLKMDYYKTHATDAAANPEENGFKAQFLSRFKTTVQSVAATEALQGLQLKSGEDVRTFFDRCIESIDIKNYVWTDVQKQTPEYIRGRNADIMAFFSAGLPDELRTLCQAGVPPETKEDWLQRAIRIQGAKKDKHHGVHAVEGQVPDGESRGEDNKSNGNHQKKAKEPSDPVEELRKEVAALRASRGRGFRNFRGRGFRGDRGGNRGGFFRGGFFRGRGRGRGGSNGGCFHCHEPHQVLGCPHLSLEERIQKAEAFLARQRGGRGRGRGRGTEGRGGHRAEHAYSIEDHEDDYEAYQEN